MDNGAPHEGSLIASYTIVGGHIVDIVDNTLEATAQDKNKDGSNDAETQQGITPINTTTLYYSIIDTPTVHQRTTASPIAMKIVALLLVLVVLLLLVVWWFL